ncbi:hypothetical protein BJ912DRAFT_902997 [Pholiota molesta]|nr:hypothetical protein BJ912DRAFT_902997 [Pholiota molesta]
MIVLEDTPKEPRTEEGEVQERSPSVSHYTPLHPDSPPAYYGPGTSSPYLPQSIPQGQGSYPEEGSVDRYGRSPARRFFRAFIVAWIVWALIALSIRSLVALVRRMSNGENGRKMDPQFDYDVPPGIVLSSCVPGGEWPRQMYPEEAQTGTGFWTSWRRPPPGAPSAAEATFDLPLEYARIFLMARGQLSSGIVDVITSSTQPSNTVSVRVHIQYGRDEAHNLAKVCKLARNAGQAPEGVGIFTPRWRDGRRREGMVFQTTVVLPEAATHDAPLFVRGLEIDAPNFVYRFADMNEKIHFGSLELRGSNQPIDVKSLSATIVDVRTKNGYIKGIFNTTKSLVLEATNTPIEVDVGMRSAEGSKPTFNARTSNGPIDAAISLLTDSPRSGGGTYTVTTSSSNGALQLQFPAQPVGAALRLIAATTNGPARVRLHPAFEGDFRLQSTAAAAVREGRGVEDPSGAGRRRLVDYAGGTPGDTRVVAGSVRWDAVGARGAARLVVGAPGAGRMVVSNTNAPLTLEL